MSLLLLSFIREFSVFTFIIIIVVLLHFTFASFVFAQQSDQTVVNQQTDGDHTFTQLSTSSLAIIENNIFGRLIIQCTSPTPATGESIQNLNLVIRNNKIPNIVIDCPKFENSQLHIINNEGEQINFKLGAVATSREVLNSKIVISNNTLNHLVVDDEIYSRPPFSNNGLQQNQPAKDQKRIANGIDKKGERGIYFSGESFFRSGSSLSVTRNNITMNTTTWSFVAATSNNNNNNAWGEDDKYKVSAIEVNCQVRGSNIGSILVNHNIITMTGIPTDFSFSKTANKSRTLSSTNNNNNNKIHPSFNVEQMHALSLTISDQEFSTATPESSGLKWATGAGISASRNKIILAVSDSQESLRRYREENSTRPCFPKSTQLVGIFFNGGKQFRSADFLRVEENDFTFIILRDLPVEYYSLQDSPTMIEIKPKQQQQNDNSNNDQNQKLEYYLPPAGAPYYSTDENAIVERNIADSYGVLFYVPAATAPDSSDIKCGGFLEIDVVHFDSNSGRTYSLPLLYYLNRVDQVSTTDVPALDSSQLFVENSIIEPSYFETIFLIRLIDHCSKFGFGETRVFSISNNSFPTIPSKSTLDNFRGNEIAQVLLIEPTSIVSSSSLSWKLFAGRYDSSDQTSDDGNFHPFSKQVEDLFGTNVMFPIPVQVLDRFNGIRLFDGTWKMCMTNFDVFEISNNYFAANRFYQAWGIASTIGVLRYVNDNKVINNRGVLVDADLSAARQSTTLSALRVSTKSALIYMEFDSIGVRCGARSYFAVPRFNSSFPPISDIEWGYMNFIARITTTNNVAVVASTRLVFGIFVDPSESTTLGVLKLDHNNFTLNQQSLHTEHVLYPEKSTTAAVSVEKPFSEQVCGFCFNGNIRQSQIFSMSHNIVNTRTQSARTITGLSQVQQGQQASPELNTFFVNNTVTMRGVYSSQFDQQIAGISHGTMIDYEEEEGQNDQMNSSTIAENSIQIFLDSEIDFTTGPQGVHAVVFVLPQRTLNFHDRIEFRDNYLLVSQHNPHFNQNTAQREERCTKSALLSGIVFVCGSSIEVSFPDAAEVFDGSEPMAITYTAAATCKPNSTIGGEGIVLRRNNITVFGCFTNAFRLMISGGVFGDPEAHEKTRFLFEDNTFTVESFVFSAMNSAVSFAAADALYGQLRLYQGANSPHQVFDSVIVTPRENIDRVGTPSYFIEELVFRGNRIDLSGGCPSLLAFSGKVVVSKSIIFNDTILNQKITRKNTVGEKYALKPLFGGGDGANTVRGFVETASGYSSGLIMIGRLWNFMAALTNAQESARLEFLNRPSEIDDVEEDSSQRHSAIIISNLIFDCVIDVVKPASTTVPQYDYGNGVGVFLRLGVSGLAAQRESSRVHEVPKWGVFIFNSSYYFENINRNNNIAASAALDSSSLPATSPNQNLQLPRLLPTDASSSSSSSSFGGCFFCIDSYPPVEVTLAVPTMTFPPAFGNPTTNPPETDPGSASSQASFDDLLFKINIEDTTATFDSSSSTSSLQHFSWITIAELQSTYPRLRPAKIMILNSSFDRVVSRMTKKADFPTSLMFLARLFSPRLTLVEVVNSSFSISLANGEEQHAQQSLAQASLFVFDDPTGSSSENFRSLFPRQFNNNNNKNLISLTGSQLHTETIDKSLEFTLLSKTGDDEPFNPQQQQHIIPNQQESPFEFRVKCSDFNGVEIRSASSPIVFRSTVSGDEESGLLWNISCVPSPTISETRSVSIVPDCALFGLRLMDVSAPDGRRSISVTSEGVLVSDVRGITDVKFNFALVPERDFDEEEKSALYDGVSKKKRMVFRKDILKPLGEDQRVGFTNFKEGMVFNTDSSRRNSDNHNNNDLKTPQPEYQKLLQFEVRSLNPELISVSHAYIAGPRSLHIVATVSGSLSEKSFHHLQVAIPPSLMACQEYPVSSLDNNNNNDNSIDTVNNVYPYRFPLDENDKEFIQRHKVKLQGSGDHQSDRDKNDKNDKSKYYFWTRVHLNLRPIRSIIPHEVKSTVKDITSATSMISAVTTANPTMMNKMNMAISFSELVECSFSDEEPPAVTQHPLGFGFGHHIGYYQRGAIVGNTILNCLFLTILILLAALKMRWEGNKRRSSDDDEIKQKETMYQRNEESSSSSSSSLLTNAYQLGFPGFVHIPLLGLLTGSISSAVALIRHSDDNFDRFLFLLGIGQTLFFLCWVAKFLFLDMKRYEGVTFRYQENPNASAASTPKYTLEEKVHVHSRDSVERTVKEMKRSVKNKQRGNNISHQHSGNSSFSHLVEPLFSSCEQCREDARIQSEALSNEEKQTVLVPFLVDTTSPTSSTALSEDSNRTHHKKTTTTTFFHRLLLKRQTFYSKSWFYVALCGFFCEPYGRWEQIECFPHHHKRSQHDDDDDDFNQYNLDSDNDDYSLLLYEIERKRKISNNNKNKLLPQSLIHILPRHSGWLDDLNRHGCYVNLSDYAVSMILAAITGMTPSGDASGGQAARDEFCSNAVSFTAIINCVPFVIYMWVSPFRTKNMKVFGLLTSFTFMMMSFSGLVVGLIEIDFTLGIFDSVQLIMDILVNYKLVMDIISTIFIFDLSVLVSMPKLFCSHFFFHILFARIVGTSAINNHESPARKQQKSSLVKHNSKEALEGMNLEAFSEELLELDPTQKKRARRGRRKSASRAWDDTRV